MPMQPSPMAEVWSSPRRRVSIRPILPVRLGVMTDRTTLTLVQPRLRREWELRRGDEAVALLSLSLFRSGAEARVGGRQLVIERQGRMRSEFLVRDSVTGSFLPASTRRDDGGSSRSAAGS